MNDKIELHNKLIKLFLYAVLLNKLPLIQIKILSF